MQIDQAPEGGKFRATAAAALDTIVGAWGDTDMLCVQLDASGELILSAAGDNCDGVIWTKEGRREVNGVVSNAVIGGKKYTVFTFAELVEAEVGSSPALSAGDDIYATALGDVTVGGVAGDIYIGSVLRGGSRLLINVNGQPVA